MDADAALSGISRDVEALVDAGPIGWFVGLLIVGLPLLSLYCAARGSRLAVLPLAISGLLGAGWVLYYATDVWPNPGLAGAIPVLAAVVIGWVVVILSLYELRQQGQLG